MNAVVKLMAGLTIVGLFAAHVAVADQPAGPIAEGSVNCDEEHPTEARAAADRLMKVEDYQRAGQCYLAAGDYDSANRAFLKSARPAVVATGQAVVQQRDAARALLNQVKGAFRSSH